MKIQNKKSISKDLKYFSPIFKDSDFIEVTEWVNGEGIDVNINDRLFNLHYDELEAINYLVKTLQYE